MQRKTVSYSPQEDETDDSNTHGSGTKKESVDNGIVYSAVKEIYAPILMNEYVRPFVVVVFVGWWILCGCLVPRVEIGLDQEVSMPSVRQNLLMIKHQFTIKFVFLKISGNAIIS